MTSRPQNLTPLPERSLMAAFLVGHRELARLLEDAVVDTGLHALDAVALRTLILNRAVTVGSIKTTLALSASTASYVVDRLVDLRYATREESPMDARVSLVRLTGVGDQASRIVDAAVRELDREILAIAEADPVAVTRVVAAIELMTERERRLRPRQW